MGMLDIGLSLVERGLAPDALTRWGIRRNCAARLREMERGDPADEEADFRRFVEAMNAGPVAPVPAKANEQHYELPPEFFGLLLGPRLKYSCCWFASPTTGLAEAEDAALSLTCGHADLRDGQDVLELGCGWGSLTLWMAGKYPGSRITAVSNSAPQRAYILAEAARRGLTNVEVLTADMNVFAPGRTFDRVVSVEMFEHMRNYGELMRRIADWLRPAGKLFIHIFCHARYAYAFETEGAANWMGRHFFTGGIMPAERLPLEFRGPLRLSGQWRWDGTHYQHAAERWLRNLDSARAEAMAILQGVYGADAGRWMQRWRVFLLACAEMFGYRGGREWLVSHYLFEKPGLTDGRSNKTPLSTPASGIAQIPEDGPSPVW